MINLSPETKAKIIRELTEERKIHELEIGRIDNDIRIMSGGDTPIIKVDIKKNTTQIIQDCLSDGIPKTNKTLTEYYNKVKGVVLTPNTFSSYLNQAVKNNPALFTIHEASTNPVGERKYVGLTEWFKDGHLMNEYVEKIKPL